MGLDGLFLLASEAFGALLLVDGVWLNFAKKHQRVGKAKGQHLGADWKGLRSGCFVHTISSTHVQ
jgi:hypothetical protein